METDPARIAKLGKFLSSVLGGERKLNSSRDGTLFIDALCCQPDVSACVHRLISSSCGLSVLQMSVRFDTSAAFLNAGASKLLKYLQDDSLPLISGGVFLERILLSIVEPPFFWDAVVHAYQSGALNHDTSRSFAWLVLQLVSLPVTQGAKYCNFVRKSAVDVQLQRSPDFDLRRFGLKIKHHLSTLESDAAVIEDNGPGGRHDNDFQNIREVCIMPTPDEILADETPFMRISQAIDEVVPGIGRVLMFIDNQFRLLREDMLGDIRDELRNVMGAKKATYHKGITIDNLVFDGISGADQKMRKPWTMRFRCAAPLSSLAKLTSEKRQKYLKDNKNFLRHQSVTCLILDGALIGFPILWRDENLLSATPPIIVLQFIGDATLSRLLSKLKVAESIKMVQLDTSVFAYEPVLRRLQETSQFSLADEMICWDKNTQLKQPPLMLEEVISGIKRRSGRDVRQFLDIAKPSVIILDDSQSDSLVSALSTRLSIIQGPPGTGKSFIGALAAKVLHDHTPQTILVVCYTNHALDQFLEDLLDIGIPMESIIRLGGKSTDRTKPLTLREQENTIKMSHAQWQCINENQNKQSALQKRLQETFSRYQSANMQKGQLMDYLEFLDDERPFFEAFTIPSSQDGMTQVGRNNKRISKFYILDRWNRGAPHAGVGTEESQAQFSQVWAISPESRQKLLGKWRDTILEDIISEICQISASMNETQKEVQHIFGLKNAELIKRKRVIACTTTGAAMYAADVQAAKPQVLLVEEAGEILESHIVTSLSSETQQMILIGDHQQLRPKVSNYDLSVEKGDGYDLNMSTFERLVRKGYPHCTLARQHRMRPEISAMVRHLTYPDLIDADSTKNRPDLRGFQDNVMFVSHNHAEDEDPRIKDRREVSSSSKRNVYEAEMVLKTVRYLAQQGYGSDSIVVLTPYLGQLKLLRDILVKENDPILNDLDASDLSRAGLLGNLVASPSKQRSVHISTIDNYQGEERDIVVVSMTRSNQSNDIGFMSAPQRLNVLLSRARNAMIMFGNVDTFKNSRKGKDIYAKFFEHVTGAGHMYEGLPIKCMNHPDRLAILHKATDFELQCPDGGCNEPCGSLLSCGLHKCPSKCHQIYDHSKIRCMAILTLKCSRGHDQKWKCHESAPLSCHKCDREDKDRAAKQKKDFERRQAQERAQQEHNSKMKKLEEEIEKVRQDLLDRKLDDERMRALEQKKRDLAVAKQESEFSFSEATAKNQQSQSPSEAAKGEPSSITTPQKPQKPDPQPAIRRVVDTTDQATSQPPKESPSGTEWLRQKLVDGVSNNAIDDIMAMTGLETVKSQVLKIKAKVDTCIRQNSGLQDERFGIVLLGNPGTGKTTVARHYAKFLASMKVLPNDDFIETTGSRLAHGGVAEIKKHIETLLAAEGGAIFVDESYQLVEAHNYNGKSVLDFMLAEIENQVGKIVFILAGYTKQMEKFFEHNPGLPSRIPYKLHFSDYEDDELLQMLGRLIDKKFGGKMSIEGGRGGLYMRILIKRLGRGRGREGFGNARALETLFSRVRERQADRLQKERSVGLQPDDYCIVKEDLIGPDPAEAIVRSKAWDKLQGLTGLKSVKESVQSSIDLISSNYQRELGEKPPIEVSLNRVLLGSPGTGKTTVAKLYGQILVDLGLLSNGEVVLKNPADFIGSALGQSETNTKSILDATMGKVLVIDEAYMLYQESGGSGNQMDPYRTAVVDTIVAEVQSVIGEDRCVLLLGYEDKMRKMFQNVNEGLSRRFPLEDAFVFADFDDSELEKIMQLKLSQQGCGATPAAVEVAIGILSRKRNGLNFGNAGEVENLISAAKIRYQRRQSALPAHLRSTDFLFGPEDFDPDFERGLTASQNLEQMFADVLGCEAVIKKLETYQKTANGMRSQGMNPQGHIPMSFVFKGPPGTGKTTTARKIGQVFYDMGLLSKAEVVECSAKDLIGEYVGQTAPRTTKQLELGLGKVLFIDEAYRLAEGGYSIEAANELVDLMTKPKFLNKLIVILAGYDEDMDRLMMVNRGLSSRFSEEIYFAPLSSEQALELLIATLRKKNICFEKLFHSKSGPFRQMIALFEKLASLQSWGNARDVQSLSKAMMGKVFENVTEKLDDLILPSSVAITVLQEMLDRRLKSEANKLQLPSQADPQSRTKTLDAVPTTKTSTIAVRAAPTLDVLGPPLDAPLHDIEATTEPETRDANVSDATWEQLQADKRAAEAAALLSAQQIQELSAAAEAVKRQRESLRRAEEANRAQMDELKRQREEERIAELHQKLARERAEAELELAMKRAKEEKMVEMERQKKLRAMGVCCAGFQWIKQQGGYRCAGGSHFVSDAQIERSG